MTVCGWISAAQSTQRKWLAILPRRTSAKHPKVRFEGSQVPLALVPTDGGRSPSQSSTMQRPSHSELSSQLFPPSLVGTTQAGEPINPTGCIEPPEASHCSAGGTCKVEGDESRVWQLAKSKKKSRRPEGCEGPHRVSHTTFAKRQQRARWRKVCFLLRGLKSSHVRVACAIAV